MAINNTLKDIREERNLIQADLAEAIGSCSQTIGRIERGERNPSLEIAIRLAHYLKVPVEDFPFLCRSTALSGSLLHKYSGIVPYCFCTYSKISSFFTIYSTPNSSDILPIIIPHFRIPYYLPNSFAFSRFS